MIHYLLMDAAKSPTLLRGISRFGFIALIITIGAGILGLPATLYAPESTGLQGLYRSATTIDPYPRRLWVCHSRNTRTHLPVHEPLG